MPHGSLSFQEHKFLIKCWIVGTESFVVVEIKQIHHPKMILFNASSNSEPISISISS
jgi:hypothetical protein